ncbi:MAG: ABC transporter substrate-binding protein [Alphaproteobacteria bacterium]|nr:ABC transporter substrate-binding protein [Alphaproteobacteria bacterium]
MAVLRKALVACGALLTGIAALAANAGAQDAPGVSKDEIKIGAFGSLTGPTYLYGKLTMNGVDAVFHKVNEAGGVNGRKLTLVREDDRCDPATAIGAVKRLAYEDGVFAIIGGGCSNAALAARPEIEKDKIPYNVFAAVADGITDPVSHYIYTTVLTSSIESKAQVQYAVQKGAKRIAVVAQHDAWGQSRYDPLMQDLKTRGITPVADLEMTVEDNDATTQALNIAQGQADAVIMVLYYKPGAVLVRSLNKLGQDPMLIGQTGIADPVAFTKQVDIPGATDKFVTPAVVKYSPSDPQVKDWVTLIKQLFPNDELSVFNLMGISAAQVMVEALKKAGPEPTREKYLDAMAHIKADTTAYAAPIECNDPVSHQCNHTPAWLRAAGDHAEIVDFTPSK